MTTKQEKIKHAEDLLKNTLMHEREVLSQLWDAAQEDLINIPQKTTKWLNIYRYDRDIYDRYIYNSYIHPTQKEADNVCDDNRIACIKIEFEEGEGLEK
jgi:hypothetical protein